MRHLRAGRKLSRRRPHRLAMLANLAVSLIKHGKLRTTDAKAKELRPFIERMITFGRRGDLHARRLVIAKLHDVDAVNKLFDEIAPKYVNRPGGYTRILKLGFRLGDNSPISIIELITEDKEKKPSIKRKKAVKGKAVPEKENETTKVSKQKKSSAKSAKKEDKEEPKAVEEEIKTEETAQEETATENATETENETGSSPEASEEK